MATGATEQIARCARLPDARAEYADGRSWPGGGLDLRIGEESPDFTGHGAPGDRGRGDPTESATENTPP